MRSFRSRYLARLRTLLDQYLSKPNDNPIDEHMNVAVDPSVEIHDIGFIAWHQYFIAKLENWLVLNGGEKFVPMPYWDAAEDIPS